ncbi:MAG: hypothetical protein WCT43_01755 [Candidatus Magasanikbacteria bacterium]|jgi:hypothetical protein
MNLKQYLILMSIGTLLCWVSWIFVIFKVSPVDSGFIGIFSFYLSLFLSIVGTFSVLGFMIRRVILKDDEVVFRHVRHTFRQSIFIATVITIVLILLSNKLLFWWNAIILVVFFIFIETVFFTSSRERPTNNLLHR